MDTSAASSQDHLRRQARRALPILVIAFVALVVGVVVGAGHVSGEQRTIEQFAAAWRKGDYAGMQAKLIGAQRSSINAATLGQAYAIAADTATLRSLEIGKPRKDGDHAWLLPVTARTAAFGIVKGTVRLPLEGDGDAARIHWAINMTFPGVPLGERLSRETTMPPRAALLARDKVALAQGSTRTSPQLGTIASSVVGQLGPIPAEELGDYRRAGYPDDAQVGISGLERIFEGRLAGTPGGRLLAGSKVLASHEPKPGKPVRTTISPKVQEAAIAALAGRLGGVLAMRPKTGEVLAAAGIAFSGLQPPGSTFKMITAAGALQDGVATPNSSYPLASGAVLSGVRLANANNEVCGGTLTQAFAISCNSVFAPLGAKLGARRLVSIAERFGFNKQPSIPGAATSMIPSAAEIGDDLALGASAIGQGRVLATTLQMTMVAGAISLGGHLPIPTFLFDDSGTTHLGARAVSPKVARQVRRMMVEVVRRGTGVRAAIPGITVAGKTGTAELRTTHPCEPTADNPESCKDVIPNDPTDTDAWFASFAPARNPRIAVGVMLVASGAGGDTAAPAARLVLEAGL